MIYLHVCSPVNAERSATSVAASAGGAISLETAQAALTRIAGTQRGASATGLWVSGEDSLSQAALLKELVPWFKANIGHEVNLDVAPEYVDDKVAAWCKAEGIRLAVILDEADVPACQAALERLQAAGAPRANIGVVATMPESGLFVDSAVVPILAFYDAGLSKGGHLHMFRPVAARSNKVNRMNVTADMARLLALLLARAEKGLGLPLSPFARMLMHGLRGQRAARGCSGGRFSVSIDTDGSIYSCTLQSSGLLALPGKGLDDSAKDAFRASLDLANEQCATCFYNDICGGFCMARELQAPGEKCWLTAQMATVVYGLRDAFGPDVLTPLIVLPRPTIKHSRAY